MQGFNKYVSFHYHSTIAANSVRYYPPDWEPSKGGLNKYHGKHALGDRARKLDQGILITRFELPFNIWCGTCNNHIGMGVRYNAEKKKIGNYYSTPIYSFRCKCHLCDGWFEIQTDPKAHAERKKTGTQKKTGDTDKEGAPIDPLAALEKTADAERLMNDVQKPRIEALQSVSDHYNSDPYTLSLKARKRFREEKKVEQQKRKADDSLKGRYGLPSSLTLLEDDERTKEDARALWLKEKQKHIPQEHTKRRKLSSEIVTLKGSSSSSPSRSASSANPVSSLRARILQNTAAKRSTAFGSISSGSLGPKG
ncbi:hypothetical protein EST38_g198 [Candolleomyces aberdarensis]|uniref:DUF572-domain-containing protein n=1 Tax=Candolleomyces aberdarensis TaxID=2316362 RepID=A0A4Q2DXZ0_9AGAR|nr:hypothetical protein EST38_g198 [Candolleomyces aberdarensis]